MRAVFFGTPAMALPALEAVARRHEVTAVVCQPDRPQGRSGALIPPPVKVWAEANGIAVAQPVKLNDGAFEAWLRDQAPDVCPLIAYGRILKQPILDVPVHGFINIHPSLLPRHRGPAPIQTAILEGDAITGVSIMRLDAGMDTGPIQRQVEEPIRPEDTSETLTERLSAIGAELLIEALDQIADGSAVFHPQNAAHATLTRTFTKADGRIHWEATAKQIDCLIRASIPWPLAQFRYRQQVFTVHGAFPIHETCSASPGEIVRVEKDRIIVSTGQGQLALTALQAPGKRAMSTADFLRGRPMMPGECLETP